MLFTSNKRQLIPLLGKFLSEIKISTQDLVSTVSHDAPNPHNMLTILQYSILQHICMYLKASPVMTIGLRIVVSIGANIANTPFSN